MSADPRLKVALVDLSTPGHNSLALGYVRAYAEADPRLAGKAGFVTLDLTLDVDPWWVAYRLVRLEPDVVGFSVKCWNAEAVRDVCSLVKRALPHVHVVVGGPEVSTVAHEFLEANPDVDCVVRGEGEETFAALLDELMRGGRLRYVEGVTSRHEGRVVSAPDRPLIRDLDSIPSPYLTGVLDPASRQTYIETYRGCPRSCAYCYEGKGYERIRRFSDERVAAEIELVASSPLVRTMTFIDPVFNLTRDRLAWLSGLLRPWAQRGLTLHTVEVDIERVDAQEARLLREAGVVSVETGPQSVNPDTLERCNRGFDPVRFAAGVAACKAEGIGVECDVIIGLPGDAPADIADALQHLIALDPGKIQLSTLHVLPGTALWERADEYGLVHAGRAPHEVVATREMDFVTLRRVEGYASAVADVYAARRDV